MLIERVGAEPRATSVPTQKLVRPTPAKRLELWRMTLSPTRPPMYVPYGWRKLRLSKTW